jgi:hypothetical protein
MTGKAVEKATSQANKLKVKFYQNGLDNVRNREMLYRFIVRPTWTFGMEVWDPDAKQLQHLESQHYQSGRLVLEPLSKEARENGNSLHPHLHNEVVLGELNWERLETEFDRSKLRFAGTIKLADGNRLLKKVVFAPKEGKGRTRRIWKEKVDALLTKYNLHNRFNKLKNPKQEAQWKRAIEKALKKHEKEMWKNRVQKHIDELHFYSLVKKEPKLESYLFTTKGKSLAAISQLNMRGGWTTSDKWSHPTRCALCNHRYAKEGEEIAHLLLQ